MAKKEEDGATATADAPGTSNPESSSPTEVEPQAQQPQATETPDTQDDGPSDEDRFKEEQAALASSQGLGEGSVPEKRPIASQERNLDYHQSKTYLEKREDGELNLEPMGKDAYDRADSDQQRSAADEASRTPNLLPGTRIRITRDGADNGRMAYVDRVQYKDYAAQQVFNSGDPGEARFAEVESYTVRTRDGRPEILEVRDGEYELVPDSDWGRGQI